MPGEFDFIRWIRDRQASHALVRLGVGDDLAVLQLPADDLLLVGVDQVLDGVHFDATVHSPRAIGRKAMNRNLSDCAAMACLPAAAVCSVALPAGAGTDYAKELFLGLTDAGQPFDCPIVGGDTASWPGKLAVTVTILGRSVGVRPVTRNGAQPGDIVYVTGPLGGSILGRHMTFEPRVALARSLAQSFRLHAMIDVSDGVARDLRHLCDAAGVGAVLDLALLPVHADVARLTDDRDPRVHALTDGEDYELLILSPDDLPPPCVRIGYVQSQPGLSLESEKATVDLDPSALIGWEHPL